MLPKLSKRARKRATNILIYLALAAFSITLITISLSEHISLFLTPSQLLIKNTKSTIRLGGLVKEKTIKKLNDNKIKFFISDHQHSIKVVYTGEIAKLFRENNGVILKGKYDIQNHTFFANEMLVKHDETYKPKNL